MFGKVITTTTVGSVTSSDILKMRYEYFVTAAPAAPFLFLTEERWFAKDIGLIYNSLSYGSKTDVYHIGAHQVF